MTTTNDKEYNICLVGSGGVGTIAAVVLEKSGRANVTTVLRSSFPIVSQQGWNISSVDHGDLKAWKPSRIVPSIEAAAVSDEHTGQVPYDYVVLSTKQLPEKYDMTALITPLITPSFTTIVLIQNGLKIHLPFVTRFPHNVTCSAVSMIGSFATGANSISQIGHDILQIGPHYHPGVDDTVSLMRTQIFIDLYVAGGAHTCTIALDMPLARYRKILWNGTYNTICALLHLNVGEVQSSGARETLVLPMMREIAAVAKADGHDIDESYMLELSRWSSETTTYRPSMLLDREAGRPMEFEVILGHPLAVAREKGIAVPIMETVYRMLELVRWKSEKGDIVADSSKSAAR